MTKLAALVLLFAPTLHGQASQPPSPGSGKVHADYLKETSQANSQAPRSGQGSTKDSPVFVEQIPAPKTTDETAKEKKDSDESAATKRLNDRFTLALVLAAGLQAVVAIFQFILFWRQTGLIREQGEMQAAALQQWIEWGELKSEAKARSSTLLHIELNLVNPTNYLLTLQRAEITFDSLRPKITVFLSRKGIPLTQGKPYLMEMDINIGEDKMRAYKEIDSGIGLSIEGTITFLSCRNKEVVQSFDGLITLGVREKPSLIIKTTLQPKGNQEE